MNWIQNFVTHIFIRLHYFIPVSYHWDINNAHLQDTGDSRIQQQNPANPYQLSIHVILLLEHTAGVAQGLLILQLSVTGKKHWQQQQQCLYMERDYFTGIHRRYYCRQHWCPSKHRLISPYHGLPSIYSTRWKNHVSGCFRSAAIWILNVFIVLQITIGLDTNKYQTSIFF